MSEKELFLKILPVLEYMGQDIMFCGKAGSGQLTKILNNMILFETFLKHKLTIGHDNILCIGMVLVVFKTDVSLMQKALDISLYITLFLHYATTCH